MQPTIFISLEAVLPGHREPALRSLLGLRMFGIAPGTDDSKVIASPAALEFLSFIVTNYGARFVITSLHTPDLDREVLRTHLQQFGLSAIAENLGQPWATEQIPTTSRADEILEWSRRHSFADFPYLVIDTHRYASELMESSLAQNTIILGKSHSGIEGMKNTVKEIFRRQQFRSQDA